MSLRAWLAFRFSMLLLGAMALFVLGLFFARQAGARGEAAALAEERARLAQLFLRQTSLAGAPITVRERRTDSLPSTGVQRALQLEPRVRELLNVVGGYLWVLSDTLLWSSRDARALDSSSLDAVNRALNEMREAKAPSRAVVLGRTGVFGSPGVMVERLETLPNGLTLRVVAAVRLSAVALSPWELLGAAVVVMPLVLALAVGGAFLVAAQATEPLERITKEVAEISDGRSLHRRLQPEEGSAELARLTTQLNEMIGRLEMSFTALRRFTADASHELKTPLAVMRADVERAMHVPQGGTEQLVALEEALHEITRMADLVESLLTLARADEGRFDLLREPVELEPLARDVFETALILGEDAGLTVTMPRVENSVVSGDRIRLRQLFLNLITNAIKYTPRDGEVELQLTATEEEASFSVRDTGIGIAAIDLPNIFDRFYRADRVRSRQAERGGFGLGLSISQWIAQAHGGTLTVQSRLHRGSTFTVTLPVSSAPGTPAAERRQVPTQTVTT
ncbi:MAG TPA: HAMP domain-containing sensor histidine kinase [Gemmatimonadaceae bacterium]